MQLIKSFRSAQSDYVYKGKSNMVAAKIVLDFYFLKVECYSQTLNRTVFPRSLISGEIAEPIASTLILIAHLGFELVTCGVLKGALTELLPASITITSLSYTYSRLLDLISPECITHTHL